MSNATSRNIFMVPVSIGEVIDKITILRIKQRMIKDESKLANVHKELEALETSLTQHLGPIPADIDGLVDSLQAINEKLWAIEDDIRECERRADFGHAFIRLARAVYFTNDERAAVKKQLNLALGSALVEEKSYQTYAS